MSMKNWPVQGYGVGINWEDKDAILNIMRSDEVIDYIKDVYKTDIDISKPKEEVDNILLEIFFDDPQGIAEGLTSAINEEIFKLCPEENHGIGYEVAHEDYFFIMFHDVKYGTKVGITTEDVDKVVEALARTIFNISAELASDSIAVGKIIENRNGVYGDIIDSYYA